MNKFCGNCGSKLDSTGRCPNCNSIENPNNGDDIKNKKLLTLLIIAISCAILIISIFATIVFRDIFSDEKTEETVGVTVSTTEETTAEDEEEKQDSDDDKDDDSDDNTKNAPEPEKPKTESDKTKNDDTTKKTTESSSKKSSKTTTSSYRDKFISALVSNQDEWNTPGSGMTTRVYFMDLNFDGELELISEYHGGSGGIIVEVYGYKNDKIVHYNIDKDATLTNVFDYYYDNDEGKYCIYGMDTTKYCYGTSVAHKDKSNYELVVIDDTIYKDFYVSECPIEGYYKLDRKAHYSLGYIEGEYNYNILGPTDDKDYYDSVIEKRLGNCDELEVTKKSVESADWKTYSDSEKKKALEKSYDSFSYN